jgi:hypothetical protein
MEEMIHEVNKKDMGCNYLPVSAGKLNHIET